VSASGQPGGSAPAPAPAAGTDATPQQPLLPGLTRNAAVQLAARTLAGVAQAAALIIVARALGPADYGRFAIVVTMTQLANVVADWGLLLIGTRTAATDRAAAPRVLACALGLRMVLGVLAAGVTVALAFASTDDGGVHLGTLVAGASLLPQAWLALAQMRGQLVLRLEGLSAGVVAGACAALAWVAVAIQLHAGIVVLSASLLASALVSAAVAMAVTPGPLPRLPAFDRALWWRLLRDSTPVAVSLTFATVYFYIDVVLLARLADAAEVGIYNAAYRFVQFGVLIPAVLVGSVYAVGSRLAQADRARFAHFVRELVSVAALLAPAPVVLLAVVPADVLHLFYGAPFAAGGNALALLAGALVLMMFTGVMGPLLVAAGRERAVMWLGGVAAAFNIGINVALIPALGAEGAALATLLTEALVALPAAVLLHRDGVGALDPRHLVRVTLAGGAGAGTVLGVPGPLLGRLAAGFVVYLCALVAFRALGRRQLALARGPARAQDPGSTDAFDGAPALSPRASPAGPRR
jgi:O-antigen/teichoic acid export membrane protein